MKFFVGLHQPSDTAHFERCCVSVNRLRRRRSDFPAQEWMMDSGAFTEISTYGDYRHDVTAYATEIRRWAHVGQFRGAVAQDFMCEPFILAITGLTVREHQRRTIDRYDRLTDLIGPDCYIIPVLQGFDPGDYARHLEDYGDRLGAGHWVGVGSVCKRNASPAAVLSVLSAIKSVRPDLRLHGFGLKSTALRDPDVVELLHSADSMAWSYRARIEGCNGNDWREAQAFIDKMAVAAPSKRHQLALPLRSGD